ncbi:hypothetical protein V5O48_007179 [Marasmius crinis-equi]|uniref:Fungal-type protein kinase domain-containing protein n=1 Tax=Marasmius crinis-equi TaxID=585013 RepID=A0ABR3FHU9_9AGAR
MTGYSAPGPSHPTSEYNYSISSLGKRKADSLPPQTQPQPPTSSSPRKGVTISTAPQTLNAARDALVKKYVGIPEKVVSEFLSDHVPYIHDAVVERVMEELKKIPKERTTKQGDTKSYTALTSEGKVWGYPGKSPLKLGMKEARTFNSLCDLIEAVLELAAKLNGGSWVAHTSKQDYIAGEKPNSSRPDSFLHLIPKLRDEVGWELLLCVGEFKIRKTYDAELDNWNWAKILWGMHHILRNDPCRLFTFGYSMEDDNARLWYHARSSVFVSESFNWIENPKPFVAFILALTLNKPEHFSSVTRRDSEAPAPAPSCTPHLPVPNHPIPITFHAAYTNPPLGKQGMDILYDKHTDYLKRIGIDPTIKRVVDENDNTQYEITVVGPVEVDGKTSIETTVFITEEVLCDWKAEHPTGRTTRVWVVHIRGGDRSVKYVLKDVWLEDGAEVGGDRLTRHKELIKADKDIDKHGIVEVEKWCNDHFLHMYTHEKFDHEVPGVRGRKPQIILIRDTTASASSAGSLHRGTQRVQPRDGPSSVPSRRKTHLFDEPARFHYRIVFKDKMTPLEKAPCRKTCCEVVIGILRAGMRFGIPLHKPAGSEISITFTIMVKGELERPKLQVPQVSLLKAPANIAQGTPHFWSVEVEAGHYLHITKGDNAADDPDDLYLQSLDAHWEQPWELPTSIFQHHLLHDLESVHWVSLWTCLYLIGPEDMDAEHGGSKDQGAKPVNEDRVELYEAIFPKGEPKVVSDVRQAFIGVGGDQAPRASLWQILEGGIRDNKVRSLVAAHFDVLRDAVVDRFVEVEWDMVPGKPISYDHPAFARALKLLHRLLLSLQSRLGDYDRFPVSPLCGHTYVLEREPGPGELERWSDPEEATIQEADGSTARPESPHTSNKRQKTDDLRSQRAHAIG